MPLKAHYHFWLNRVLKTTFDLWQFLGFHATPNHFYSPIPDTRALDERVWANESQLVGVDINEEAQLTLLDEFQQRFAKEYAMFPLDRGTPGTYYLRNLNYGSVDGECLYCMIRKFQPRRMIEIGSGFSTLIARQAIERNQQESGVMCRLTTIDPNPSSVVRQASNSNYEIIKQKVEDTPVETFADLEENDILFIDSSHVLKIGGDVRFEYLEIIPRLRKGVLVHVHDIFLPREYPRRWVFEERRFWNEQYILQAFLSFNREFEVLWAGSYLNAHYRTRLVHGFPSLAGKDYLPSSFWMRRRH